MNNLSKPGDLYEYAIVTEIGNRSVDVIVPRFGIEKRVWVEDLVSEDQAAGCQFDSKTISLKVHWKTKESSMSSLIRKMGDTNLENKKMATEDDKDDNWEDVKDIPKIKIQKIQMFDTIKVRIKPLLERSPPALQLHLVYPTQEYKTSEIFSVVEDIFILKASMDDNAMQSLALCPGMADDRD